MNECPPRYMMTEEGCQHYLFPPDVWQIVGTLMLCASNGLATMAGVGGGSIAIVFLMFFFEYLPKDATLVVFCSILGTSFGNVTNLINKAHNGKSVIQFHFVFTSIPIMLAGSFIGVLLNKFLPSIIVCLLITVVFATSISSTYRRFKAEDEKETAQNLINLEEKLELIKETTINPWKSDTNREIFKNMAAISALVLLLSIIRGSEKFPSILGVQPCSSIFWALQIGSFFLVGLYGWRNLQILKGWYQSPPEMLKEYLEDCEASTIQENIGEIVKKSLLAGIMSGFGLGGGIFLVSMYRNLKCSPLQATASCAMSIFVTSFMNCFQAITIGSLQIKEFGYFIVILSTGGFIVSKIVSNQLRKRNRLSYVQAVLVFLITFAVINIPLSLIRKYVQSGYNNSIVFGFGSVC